MAKQDTSSNEAQSQQNQQVARGQQQGQQQGLSGAGHWRSPLSFSPFEIFRLGPFEMLRRFSQEMEHGFGESWGGGEQQIARWSPAIEVSEREGKYSIRAELPGVNADDVQINVGEDSVIIEGERRDERERDIRGMHVTERRYGRFYRAIPLPEGAQTDGATAKFDNGVLEVEVPVEQKKAERRRVQIQSGSRGQQQQQQQGEKQPSGAPSKAA